MLDDLDKEAVERVGRDARELAPDQERFQVGDDFAQTIDGQQAPFAQVVGGHQDRVAGLGAPPAQPQQAGPCLRVFFVGGVDDPLVVRGSTGEVTDGVLDRLLTAPGQALQPVLMNAIHVIDRDIQALALQFDAGQAFQVREADHLLHRPPDLGVDLGAAGREQHEDQVAQQVCLGQADTGRIEGLEDPVRVVSRSCGDVDDGQAFDDDGGEPAEVEWLVCGAGELEAAAEETVGLADRVLGSGFGAGSGWALDVREERGLVSLGGDQPEALLALLELVDEVQLVVALDGLLVGAGRRVPDRGQ